jgi:hypothetical protein
MLEKRQAKDDARGPSEAGALLGRAADISPALRASPIPRLCPDRATLTLIYLARPHSLACCIPNRAYGGVHPPMLAVSAVSTRYVKFPHGGAETEHSRRPIDVQARVAKMSSRTADAAPRQTRAPVHPMPDLGGKLRPDRRWGIAWRLGICYIKAGCARGRVSQQRGHYA